MSTGRSPSMSAMVMRPSSRSAAARAASFSRLSSDAPEKLTVWADPQMDWTLDGEYAKGAQELQIENLHSAVQIVVNN